jgi:A/G-specific adenine glycosylase
VSEIMLQQTTVSTVKNHFERFLIRFPTLKSLAEASEQDLLIAWKGLGYYRRARNLKKIALELVENHGGLFPQHKDDLMKIPGIGPYTANAIMAIGMDKRALAVDANLERVISRLFGLKSPKGPKLQGEIQKLFEEKKIFKQTISFRALNEALMDLGRTYCQARKVSCELCPLRSKCNAFAAGTPLKYPYGQTGLKEQKDHEVRLLRIYIRRGDEILVYKKRESEWLTGQYEVPTFILSSTDKALSQYPGLNRQIDPLFSFRSGITKYKITNDVVTLSLREFKKIPFSGPTEWRKIDSDYANFSTATIKGLTRLRTLMAF